MGFYLRSRFKLIWLMEKGTENRNIPNTQINFLGNIYFIFKSYVVDIKENIPIIKLFFYVWMPLSTIQNTVTTVIHSTVIRYARLCGCSYLLCKIFQSSKRPIMGKQKVLHTEEYQNTRIQKFTAFVTGNTFYSLDKQINRNQKRLFEVLIVIKFYIN